MGAPITSQIGWRGIAFMNVTAITTNSGSHTRSRISDSRRRVLYLSAMSLT